MSRLAKNDQARVSIAVIINPVAGRAGADRARRAADVAVAMLAASHEPSEVFVTERPGHARELAAGAVSRGARLVIAWGGDGTVNEVGSAVVSTSAALGIVPAGSGNGLAYALGVAREPERAVTEALKATPRRMDVGELGGRIFLNVAGVGFDAEVARRFQDRPRLFPGWLGYVRITLGALITYRPDSYRITIREGVTSCRALFVTFANSSQYGNGARIAPNAVIDDGQLDMVTFVERSRLTTLFAIPRLFVGGIEHVDGVSTRPVEAAMVESDRPILFHVDGEAVLGGTRLTVQVLPKTLLVAVR